MNIAVLKPCVVSDVWMLLDLVFDLVCRYVHVLDSCTLISRNELETLLMVYIFRQVSRRILTVALPNPNNLHQVYISKKIFHARSHIGWQLILHKIPYAYNVMPQLPNNSNSTL